MDVGHPLSADERKLFTPRSVEVAVQPDGTMLVSWKAPLSLLPVAWYRVLCDAFEVVVVPATQTSTMIELDSRATHYIQIQSVDADGNRSDLTASVIVGLPLPGPPPIRDASIAFRLAAAAPGRHLFVIVFVGALILLSLGALAGLLKGDPLQLEGPHRVLHSVDDPPVTRVGTAPGSAADTCYHNEPMWSGSVADGGWAQLDGNTDFESPESVITVREADGSIRWTRRESLAFACATVADDVLVVKLVAFTEDNGVFSFCQSTKCWQWHSGLQAFDLETGEPLWWASADRDINQLGTEGGVVVVVAGSGGFDPAWDVHALEAETGEELWSAGGENTGGGLSLGDGVAYVQLAEAPWAQTQNLRYAAWDVVTGQPVTTGDPDKLDEPSL